jgi:hypothetical protein
VHEELVALHAQLQAVEAELGRLADRVRAEVGSPASDT